MEVTFSFGVDENGYLPCQQTKRHKASFAIVMAYIFACHGWVIPNVFRVREIHPMTSEIAKTLPFVPCRHDFIVVTKRRQI